MGETASFFEVSSLTMECDEISLIFFSQVSEFRHTVKELGHRKDQILCNMDRGMSFTQTVQAINREAFVVCQEQPFDEQS